MNHNHHYLSVKVWNKQNENKHEFLKIQKTNYTILLLNSSNTNKAVNNISNNVKTFLDFLTVNTRPILPLDSSVQKNKMLLNIPTQRMKLAKKPIDGQSSSIGIMNLNVGTFG